MGYYRKNVEVKHKVLGSNKYLFIQIFEFNVFPKYPYERENSSKFFSFVKYGDMDNVRRYIKICKYHVYDFDCVKIIILL